MPYSPNTEAFSVFGSWQDIESQRRGVSNLFLTLASLLYPSSHVGPFTCFTDIPLESLHRLAIVLLKLQKKPSLPSHQTYLFILTITKARSPDRKNLPLTTSSDCPKGLPVLRFAWLRNPPQALSSLRNTLPAPKSYRRMWARSRSKCCLKKYSRYTTARALISSSPQYAKSQLFLKC